jgi:hypothetical protein
MWTDTTRVQYARTGLALPSDLTDAEWAVLEPFLPPPSFVGRPRKWPMRRIETRSKWPSPSSVAPAPYRRTDYRQPHPGSRRRLWTLHR